MGIHEKLAALDHIYRVYENFISEYEVACRRGCDRCCTRNVILTTLEAYKISTHLIESGQESLLERLSAVIDGPRFIPRVTTNGLAEICMRGEDPPEEASDPAWGPCPLLDDGQCPLYAVRPFGCRCMVSARRCDDAGFAEMDPFLVTVNNVMLQYIEHIDRDGCSGNLADLLVFMSSGENRRRYRDGGPEGLPAGLIRNRAIRALMVPPRHRERIMPVMKSLERPPPDSSSRP
jgi:hypothetical protein